MKSLQVENRRLALVEKPIPESDGEALVRVLMSGICGTDLEIAKGYSGFTGTVGHEFVGIVEECFEDPSIVGKRVVGEINAGCGTCALCNTGDPRHCPRRTVLGIVGRDGAHAEFLKLPTRNLLEVPENVSDRAAVFVEPLAAAIGISERFQFEEDSKVAVIGDGKLGILCARALAATPPAKSVTLIGKHDAKLRLAGRTNIETTMADNAAKLTHYFDVVVEASGSAGGLPAALGLVKPLGTIVLKSTFHGLTKWDASPVVVNEVTIVGSRCGRFKPALDLLANKQIEVEDLISRDFSLSEGVRAFEFAGAKGTLKVLLSIAGK